MKALILAGGRGTRLRPITHTSAKQLVPVANKPVLYYGLEAVREAGITEVGIIVSDPSELLRPDHRTGEKTSVMVDSQEEIRKAVGDGSRFGLKVTYIVQEAPLGLAHAVKVAQPFLGTDPFVMYLGDNLLKDGIVTFVEEFRSSDADAQILLAEVPNPEEFGVAQLEGDRVVKLVEKPRVFLSRFALVGVYLFTSCIFEAVDGIKPSARGELEITDAIQYLIDHKKRVRSHVIRGWWKDTGKVEDMLEANRIVLADLKHRVEGTVEDSEIEGPVIVEPGATVRRSRLRGPLIIGRGASVTDSYVGPFTAIGDEVVLDHCEIEHSIVLEKSRIMNIETRIESSLIGRGVEVTGKKIKPRSHRLLLGEHSRVELS